MGFIAQEAQSVIPECVDGKEGSMSMQYAPVTALLVEAMKEQQTQIEQLEKRMTELEDKVWILSGKIELNEMKTNK
jgi:TolA-binding protein